MAGNQQQPSAYRRGIGHVHLSGGHLNVDVTARKVVDDRSVEISRQRVNRPIDTRKVEITPDVAKHFAEVLSAVDSWDELHTFVMLLWDAAKYEGAS